MAKQQSKQLMQVQTSTTTLEHLRDAELHQTRQELAFLMQRCNDLDAQNHGFVQRLKMQELDHESLTRYFKQFDFVLTWNLID